MIAMEDRRREEIEREIAATARHESTAFLIGPHLRLRDAWRQRQVLVELCSVPPVLDQQAALEIEERQHIERLRALQDEQKAAYDSLEAALAS